MWSREQASALTAVFDALNQSGVPWLVLRNYEGLPDINHSKDIDLGVDKESFNKAFKIISDVLRAHDFDRLLRINYSSAHCLTFFKSTEENVKSIKIDLVNGMAWRGAQILTFDHLYARRVPYRNFSVPDSVNDGFMLWMKSTLMGENLKDRYSKVIHLAAITEPEYFHGELQYVFGHDLTEVVWPLIRNNQSAETLAYRRSLVWAAWRMAAWRNSGRTLMASMAHIYCEVARRARRSPASLLAVVGPDGVGKTTFITLLQQELARVLVKNMDSIQVQHFRPNILPNIKELISGKNYDSSTEEFSKPHRALPASLPSSLVRLVYYWSDYVIGYWLVIRRKCTRGTVMIFDRYFYDFIVDPRRSRINLPAWVRKLVLRLTPQPDLVFFLDCDADTVYARKQELTRDEIERQLWEYRKLVAADPKRFVRLDANQLPDISCRQALQVLVERSFPRT